MRELLKRSDLFAPEHELVELMENLNFGRIEHLQFRDGKPIVQPLPRVIAAVKMAARERQDGFGNPYRSLSKAIFGRLVRSDPAFWPWGTAGDRGEAWTAIFRLRSSGWATAERTQRATRCRRTIYALNS